MFLVVTFHGDSCWMLVVFVAAHDGCRLSVSVVADDMLAVGGGYRGPCSMCLMVAGGGHP